MTSNMLAGERRWASARRGGMKVLGKVTVPKPLNLPSQRLENHGLNPNVEIVPNRGTLSWGSRSSSPASNAWGSSTLSPTADGSTGSPSYLSGRPSSGSGTRPSTAGSDRTHEPTGNAWGPNSRPSSASGVLTSNQTLLTPSRPRTAETRPGSSQLSRFAGTSSDNSVAWGTSGTAEKLGLSSSKNDAFSLSTGDFPTLGSERDNSGRTAESQEHGSYSRPGSSSGGVATTKGDVSVNSNEKSGTVVTWKRDSSQHVDDSLQPSSEKWHGDPQNYLNANVPHQHFDAWHGPPINAPGVWYRGPPGGPPYGTPIAPGGFPREPFPPYHYQIPPNSQPVPPPGAGPRGPHPKSGDFHRSHVPDVFIRPPITHGFYPGPMPYEGYYGPPMSYCHSGERDIPFMGVPAGPSGPSGYNRYSGQNAPDPNNNFGRVGGHGPTGKTMVSEQSGHFDDTRGPYKVLLKQHSEYDGKEEEGKWEHKKDEDVYARRKPPGEDVPSRTFDNRGGAYSSDFGKVKIGESRGNSRVVDESLVKKSENVSSALPELPQVDSTLIQKIEGLNAKARTSDERHGGSISGREEQKSRVQVDVKANHSANIAGTGDVSNERILAGGDVIPASHRVDVSYGDKSIQPAAVSVAAISRGASRGVEGQFDHHRGKKFNAQDADGWRKKPLAAESTIVVWSANVESTSNPHVQDQHTSVEAAEKSGINPQGKDEGESLTPGFDPSDSHAQRAKMREIAKQRAKQLQEEEEERTREQKAKALAKLEELNRRIQAAPSTQKLEKVPPSDAIQKEQEESQTPVEPAIVAQKYEKPISTSVSNPSVVVAQVSDSCTVEGGESTILLVDTLTKTLDSAREESVVPQEDVHGTGAIDSKTARQVGGSSVSKHKRIGYKPKQNLPSEKNLTEKSIPITTTETPKDHTDVNDVPSMEVVAGEVDPNSSSSINSGVMVESPAQQRRKNSRSSKNKQKLEDASSFTSSPLPLQKEINPRSVQSVTDTNSEIKHLEQRSLPSDDAHGRVNNQLKSQHSRRMPRAPQGNRSGDKFHNSDAVWAPVTVRLPQNRSEVTDQASRKTIPDTVTPTMKSDNLVHNSLKSKRAEMERYVPKPVAKELAQQGSIQQPGSSSTNQTSSDEVVGRTEPGFQSTESSQSVNSAVGNVGSTSEAKNGDDKQSKQLKDSKPHGSWRQRGSTESPLPQGLQDVSSFSSNPGKNVQKSIHQNQPLMPDVNPEKGQEKDSDEWGISDGWYIPEIPETAAPISSRAPKDQGIPGRGKRNQFKSHRSMGTNYDLDDKNTNSVDTDKSYRQSTAVEMSQADTIVASKESRGTEERTSHWQPKSQAYSGHNRGSKSSGGQNVTEVGRAVKKESTEVDRIVAEQKNVAEAASVGYQEAKRERKASSLKGRTDSPNQGPVNTVEQTSTVVDTRHEQRPSSGFRKNGNQNNRSGRGHESGGDWSIAGQDHKLQDVPANRERQRRYNSHYEYQPKSNNFEGSDGSNNMGSRYRERGQGHPRRGGGNFYGRQGGTVRVDAGYD